MKAQPLPTFRAVNDRLCLRSGQAQNRCVGPKSRTAVEFLNTRQPSASLDYGTESVGKVDSKTTWRVTRSSIRKSSSANNSFKTLLVCWPSRGAGDDGWPGALDNLTGVPVTRCLPAVGWSRNGNISRTSHCG